MEVDGRSSIDGLEVQYHCLESDAGSNRNLVEVTEGGHIGEFGKIVIKLRCSILDTLHRFIRRGWESSHEGVAVVRAGIDQRLDQELHMSQVNMF